MHVILGFWWQILSHSHVWTLRIRMSSSRMGIDILMAISMRIFALNSKHVSLESWHVSLLVWSEIDLDQYRFLHIMASATTNSYTRNSCDSEPAWNWNAYAHCCLLEDSMTLWHMIHMNAQHVCLVVRWFVLLTLHISVQLNPHPHSMRLRLRIFVWPGLAWLLNLMYTFVYEKSVAIFKEQSISFFNCCRFNIYFCSFKLIQVFILPKLPYVTLSTMSSLDWFGPGGARHKLHKRVQREHGGPTGHKGPNGSFGTGTLCVLVPGVNLKQTAASFNSYNF